MADDPFHAADSHCETLIPADQNASQPCYVIILDSETETQPLGDPDETQFESTQPMDWDRLLCYQTDCSYEFNWGGEEDVMVGTLSILSNWKSAVDLDSVTISVRYSRDRTALRANLSLTYMGLGERRWEACHVSTLSGYTVREFVCNLSLGYVGLATTDLCLDFLSDEKLKATLTNTLKGPDEQQTMVFECTAVQCE